MATSDEIDALRRLIDESESCDPFTDEKLDARINAADSIEILAAQIWREKAASYASAVDMQEGNSSRKLSQLASQALAMAKAIDPASTTVPVTRQTVMRSITRV